MDEQLGVREHAKSVSRCSTGHLNMTFGDSAGWAPGEQLDIAPWLLGRRKVENSVGAASQQAWGRGHGE
jgi:hypothetical protein